MNDKTRENEHYDSDENEMAERGLRRDRCPLCGKAIRITMQEEDGEHPAICPECPRKMQLEIYNARSHWRLPRPRRRSSKGGGGRASMLQRWPMYSRGGEEPLFPEPREKESGEYMAGRQFAEKIQELRDGKKEEDFDEAGENSKLQTSVTSYESSVVTSFDVPQDVFGEVEVNLEPVQSRPVGPLTDVLPSVIEKSGVSNPVPMPDVTDSLIPPLAAELNYDVTGPGTLGVPYERRDGLLDQPEPADGLGVSI